MTTTAQSGTIYEQADRVRRSTSLPINREIDRQTKENIRRFSAVDRRTIVARIEALDREWDIERDLEVNASSLALTRLVLGLAVNRKWLLLPGVVLPFLLQHGVQGWCPPLPILRRLGFAREARSIRKSMHRSRLWSRTRGKPTPRPHDVTASDAFRQTTRRYRNQRNRPIIPLSDRLLAARASGVDGNRLVAAVDRLADQGTRACIPQAGAYAPRGPHGHDAHENRDRRMRTPHSRTTQLPSSRAPQARSNGGFYPVSTDTFE